MFKKKKGNNVNEKKTLLSQPEESYKSFVVNEKTLDLYVTTFFFFISYF